MASRSQVREEEDDLDDLDDIVDQFDSNPSPAPGPASPQPGTASSPPQASSVPSKPIIPLAGLDDELPEDLARQLAEGMESLMRELADAVPGSGATSEEDRKRREAWEKMLIEGMDGLSVDEKGKSVAGPSGSANPAATTGVAEEDEFQKSIRQAMEKLKNSDSTLHSDASSAAASSDALENILSQLGSGFDDIGEDNEELQGMLETMMRQLMSKEVLYEPLKELHEKFPDYLKENDATLSEEDKTRYGKQVTCVSQIVTEFEDPAYKDDDQEKGARILALMNEMQTYGSPPTEIMGPMPPGFDFGADGTPKLPEGCTIS